MKILVVDDEINIVKLLKEIFEEAGHNVEVAYNGQQAIENFTKFNPDVIFLDVKMPILDGIQALEKIKKRDTETVIIMVSGHSNIPIAVKAIKIGAYDFLEKPLSLPLVRITLNKAIQHLRISSKIKNLQSDVDEKYTMIGTSPQIKQMMSLISKVAVTNAKVLIRGESGSGKELVAWAIHSQSKRVQGSFIRFNSAAIPNELVESELFGFEKGAFTGAHATKKGKIEEADGGTLFLDEIGDMSLSAQAKILRVIQEGEFERVGSNKPLKIDARIIAATHKNLEELVSKGLFRQDLFYRLNVVPIEVPSLKERIEDVPVLVAHFSRLNAFEMKVPTKQFTDKAIQFLQNMPFNGNIRELKNLIERVYIICDEIKITHEILAQHVNATEEKRDFWSDTKPFSDKKSEFEERYLTTQLKKYNLSISNTSQALALQQSNLSRKLKDLNIDVKNM